MVEDLARKPTLGVVARAGTRPVPGTLGGPLIGGVQVRTSTRADGDMAGYGLEVERRRRSLVDLPWTVLRQVHGAHVEIVHRPGGAAGRPADAAVTQVPGTALAVLTADCAPVALAGDTGVVGIAHAGWRGLAAGVIAATVDAMRSFGAVRIEAVIGPSVGVHCYSFGADHLDAVAATTGPEVRGRDAHGAPALDLAAGVRGALHRAGVDRVAGGDKCTACSDELWSWRGRADRARQATVAWLS